MRVHVKKVPGTMGLGGNRNNARGICICGRPLMHLWTPIQGVWKGLWTPTNDICAAFVETATFVEPFVETTVELFGHPGS